MAEPFAILALALDAAMGWPDHVYRRIGHPVGAFAAIIDKCEGAWNRPERGEHLRKALGVVTVTLLVAISAGGGWMAQALLVHWLGPQAWIACGILAFPGLAQRSLYDHVRAVQTALDHDGLADARIAVSMIVGRDTATLDEAGVARAAIESLAESFCDGIAAPLFWLLVFGLPGIWAYKAINTADSMIGHREERWRAFGWAAARGDDVLNLLPARLGATILCIAGNGGWRITWRDAGKHASPNAGWTEAALAGALGIRLAGPVAYDGVMIQKPWIGDGRTAATANDIVRALSIYLRACALLWFIAGGVTWAI
jgi:adenosylcobinamide-phosphate synthase